MTDRDLPSLPDAAVARRQLQVILVLDCSGSMRGEKIASLNYAIRSAIPELRSVAEENPEIEVMVTVLRFSTEAAWHVEEPTVVDALEWIDLEAEGETAMGAALAAVKELLEGDKLVGRQLPPVAILVSDGMPTDDFEEQCAVFLKSEMAKQATRLAIAIGDTADQATLQNFINSEGGLIKPLKARNAPDLVRYIKWATTAPVKATSTPKNSPTPEDDLAHQMSQLKENDSEIVW